MEYIEHSILDWGPNCRRIAPGKERTSRLYRRANLEWILFDTWDGLDCSVVGGGFENSEEWMESVNLKETNL